MRATMHTTRRLARCWRPCPLRTRCASPWSLPASRAIGSTAARWPSRMRPAGHRQKRRNKRADRGKRGLRLVAVRRVAAVGENDALDRRSDLALDSVKLLQRPVPVVLSLYEQHRTAYPGQPRLDVPLAELAREPDIVP